MESDEDFRRELLQDGDSNDEGYTVEEVAESELKQIRKEVEFAQLIRDWVKVTPRSHQESEPSKGNSAVHSVHGCSRCFPPAGVLLHDHAPLPQMVEKAVPVQSFGGVRVKCQSDLETFQSQSNLETFQSQSDLETFQSQSDVETFQSQSQKQLQD